MRILKFKENDLDLAAELDILTETEQHSIMDGIDHVAYTATSWANTSLAHLVYKQPKF